jgi:hypothetical protein
MGLSWDTFVGGVGDAVVPAFIVGIAIGVGAAILIATGPAWVPIFLALAGGAALGYALGYAYGDLTSGKYCNPDDWDRAAGRHVGSLVGASVGGAIGGGLGSGVFRPPAPTTIFEPRPLPSPTPVVPATGPDGNPLPPGWNPNWMWRYPEGTSVRTSPRWFDTNGGEWRWHGPDKWHPDGHWDHNPWTNWNSPWRNVAVPPNPPGGNGTGGAGSCPP